MDSSARFSDYPQNRSLVEVDVKTEREPDFGREILPIDDAHERHGH